MDVNDIVAAKIAAAKWRAEQERKRRAELAEARRVGLARRHAAKLARLAEAAVDNTTLAASGA